MERCCRGPLTDTLFAVIYDIFLHSTFIPHIFIPSMDSCHICSCTSSFPRSPFFHDCLTPSHSLPALSTHRTAQTRRKQLYYWVYYLLVRMFLSSHGLWDLFYCNSIVSSLQNTLCDGLDCPRTLSLLFSRGSMPAMRICRGGTTSSVSRSAGVMLRRACGGSASDPVFKLDSSQPPGSDDRRCPKEERDKDHSSTSSRRSS